MPLFVLAKNPIIWTSVCSTSVLRYLQFRDYLISSVVCCTLDIAPISCPGEFFCVPRCSRCVSFVKITGFASHYELQEFAHIFVCKLQWRQIERDGVSNHQPHRCLRDRLFRRRSKKTSKPCITGLCEGNSPDRLFRRRSKKTSKPRITGLCEGNSPVTGEFPAQRASNAEIFPCDDVIKTRVYLIVHSRPHSR